MFNGKTPSPALVKAALINSAVDMDNSLSPSEGGTTFVPNNDEGWGRVDLTELIGSEREYDFTDQTVLLRTAQTFEKHLVLASGDLPLKVTLTYTDVPGFPPAIPALVNDLDLEVVGEIQRLVEAGHVVGFEGHVSILHDAKRLLPGDPPEPECHVSPPGSGWPKSGPPRG